MNRYAIQAIYSAQMRRAGTTWLQSLVAPSISGLVYVLIFAIGVRAFKTAEGRVSYDAFVIPGILLLVGVVVAVSEASMSLFLKKYSGTIYEEAAAPVSWPELLLGYVAAAVTKALLVVAAVFAGARLLTGVTVARPAAALLLLVLCMAIASALGVLAGVRARAFDSLQNLPLLIITPLAFFGGLFFSPADLPALGRLLSDANPLLYMIESVRWAFVGRSDIPIGTSLAVLGAETIAATCAAAVPLRRGFLVRR